MVGGMRRWLRPLKLGTEADFVVLQRLPPSTRSDLAENLSAELLVEQQAPFDPRRGAVPGLRASTFSVGTALFSEECASPASPPVIYCSSALVFFAQWWDSHRS